MDRILLAVLGIFLLFGVFSSSIIDGVKNVRTEDTTQEFTVTTAAGQTTANVTLSGDLFQDDVSEVITVTSNRTGESPVATSYATATNYLLVSALDASQTRTLTVNYYAEAESTVWRAIGPFMSFMVIGFLAFMIVQSARKKH